MRSFSSAFLAMMSSSLVTVRSRICSCSIGQTNPHFRGELRVALAETASQEAALFAFLGCGMRFAPKPTKAFVRAE